MKKNQLILSGVLCAFVCLIFGCRIQSNSNEVSKLKSLEENVESPVTVEELTDAIEKYSEDVDEVVTKNAQIGIWYKMLASSYMDKKMYALALKNYQKAIEFYPCNQNLYYWTGVCAGFMAQSSLDYDAQGVNQKKINYLRLSESSYLQAIKIDPTYLKPMYGLSVLYIFELDEAEKAIPVLEKYLTIDTKNADAMMLLARAYYTSYEFEKAVEVYNRIIKESKSEIRRKEALENKKAVLGEAYGE